MVFCGDCGNPTRIDGNFRKCDTCRTSTRLKPVRKPRLGLESLRASVLLADSIRDAQRQLDEMQVNQFGDSVPT